ncbi:hypothetical protein C6P45_001451 [Maudiozyma exigua]|uniref:Uncharacterized protein n=1 Tax=Maudiozyma exigua TaxID=34358 RepID=A0A9P6W083_MAUEX|nr:hypothetical protein C6P45_001451 [Kazachstania exigua]
MTESLNVNSLSDKIHRRTSLSFFEESNGAAQVHSDKHIIDSLNSSTRRLITKINQISDGKNVVFPKQESNENLETAPLRYLTPNLINSDKSTFPNETTLQVGSPGIFSVKTISTSALDDMLYWDSSTDIINNKINPRRNSERSNVDNSDPNRIYEISGDTILRSYSKLSEIVGNGGDRDFNIAILPSPGEESSKIRHPRISREINEAAELLRADMYYSPDAKQSRKISLPLNVCKYPQCAWHPNCNGSETHMLADKETTPSSHNKLREFEKYSVDSANLYKDSPTHSVSAILQNSAKTKTWRYNKEGRNTNYTIFTENDRAEPPQSAIPADREKNMPFQHVDYDSVISLDSTNPTFEDIFSTWKITVVLLTCIAMPPFFYIIHYAGHGGMSDEQVEGLVLQDSYLRDPLRGFYWDVNILWFKRLCFYLGTIECLLIIACICIGFGVGLTKGQ